MGPGRQKAAPRGRTLFLTWLGVGASLWELLRKGGTLEDICSCSLAPLFAD